MVKATKLYVGNLSALTKSKDLKELFEKYGNVEECDVLRNYGFVHMSCEKEANIAVECLNNEEFMGSKITVEISRTTGQCHVCGRTGHLSKDCAYNPKTQKRSRSRPTKLYIGNVPDSATVPELKTLFEKYGEVEECDILKNYGFVHMTDEGEARDAVTALNDSEFCGGKIHVKVSHNNGQCFRCGRPGWVNECPCNPKSLSKKSTKLYVGNLPDSSDSKELREMFEKFGTVEECDILKHFGFVHMSNVKEARAAMEALNDTEFNGSKIIVKVSRTNGECYQCGQQGHWSKDCHSYSARYSSRPSYGSRFGMDRGMGNRYSPDRMYGDRMRPYPDPYERRIPSSMGASDDYMAYRRTSYDFYRYPRQSPPRYGNTNNFAQSYDFTEPWGLDNNHDGKGIKF